MSTASESGGSDWVATGWTRDDWIGLLARLTDGFVRAIPPGGSPARAALPGAAPSDPVPAIEGFARMSVAWAAWLHERENPATLLWQGREHDVAALIARGLTDASDPSHPAWWGPIADRDQRIVEASEVSTAIWLGGARLRSRIDALDPAAFDRLLDWLALVDGRDVWPDNWVLFPMLSRLVRQASGRTVDVAAIDAAVDDMLARDVGDGWTSDGPGHALDLYSGWAIHWHLLWWAAIDGKRRPAVRRRVMRRAQAWLRFVAAAVGTDGSFPRFGRSLGYRFAVAAPFAQAALLGLDPLPPGTARRLASGVIRHALGEGAVDPATDWLRVGVAGERRAVVERYVSAGAVAWAAHAFVALGLSASHPFWTAPESPLPADRAAGGAVAAPRAGLLVTWSGGATTIHNARTGHPADIPDHDYAATYGKLAYRSAHPFDVPVVPGARAGSDDAVTADGNGSCPPEALRIVHRNESVAGGAGPGWIHTRYGLEADGARLRTVVLVLDDVEVRVSAVHPGAPIRLRDGGPALGHDRDDVAVYEDPVSATIAISHDGRTVAIRALAGFDARGTTGLTSGRMNLVHDRTTHPWVAERTASGRPRLVASALVVGRSRRLAVEALGAIRFEPLGVTAVRVEAHGGLVSSVSLGTTPPHAMSLGGVTVAGPAVRIALVDHERSVIAGERITRIDGVAHLARPAIVRLARTADGVEATTTAGLDLDPRWARRELRWARFAVAGWPVAEPVRLHDAGAVPDALVRRVARRAGTSLLEIVLE